MANSKREATQAYHHVDDALNSKVLESIQENRALTALGKSPNREEQPGVALNNGHLLDVEESLNSQPTLQHGLEQQTDSQLHSALESLNMHKGKVADMVDKINHTPNNSPVSSPKARAPRQHTVVLPDTQSKIMDTTDSKLNSVIQNLAETSKALSDSVAQLQQELSTLRTQKTQQDKQVSDLNNIQKADAQKLQNALRTIEEHDKRFEAIVGILSRQKQEIAGLKKTLNNMSVRAARCNMVLSGVVEQ